MTELLKLPETPYLTVVHGRTPKQKVHKRLSDAKNAFDTPRYNSIIRDHPDRVPRGSWMTHGWGQIYEMIDGEWALIVDVPQPSEVTDKYPYHVDARPWKNK